MVFLKRFSLCSLSSSNCLTSDRCKKSCFSKYLKLNIYCICIYICMYMYIYNSCIFKYSYLRITAAMFFWLSSPADYRTHPSLECRANSSSSPWSCLYFLQSRLDFSYTHEREHNQKKRQKAITQSGAILQQCA